MSPAADSGTLQVPPRRRCDEYRFVLDWSAPRLDDGDMSPPTSHSAPANDLGPASDWIMIGPAEGGLDLIGGLDDLECCVTTRVTGGIISGANGAAPTNHTQTDFIHPHGRVTRNLS